MNRINAFTPISMWITMISVHNPHFKSIEQVQWYMKHEITGWTMLHLTETVK